MGWVAVWPEGRQANAEQIFSRERGGSSLALLNTYASVLQSYCNTGDPFCASGTDESVHSAEVQDYESAATAFIVAKNK
jgi:acetylxylan esterase